MKLNQEKNELVIEVVTIGLIVVNQLYSNMYLQCMSLLMAVVVCVMEYRHRERDKTVRYLLLGFGIAFGVLLAVTILQIFYPAA